MSLLFRCIAISKIATAMSIIEWTMVALSIWFKNNKNSCWKHTYSVLKNSDSQVFFLTNFEVFSSKILNSL